MSRQIFRYLFFVLIFYYLPGSAQIQFSQQEALEDLKALKTALEYVHPRLYKYQDEATFNRLFNQKSSALKDQIPGVDLLAIVSQINAQVNCGHLYTIPQLELREELQQRKVFPFFVKVIRNELYISNDCSLNEASSNGAKILSINGHKSSDILSKMKAGIATDGFIESRKDRLIERSLFSLRNGFDLYYFLYLDRSDSFEIELTLAGEKQKTTIKFVAINRDVRKQRLLDLYQINENRWFQNPSPSAEFSVDKNYAVLSLPRSFHNPKIDPPFNDFLKAFFDKLKIDSIHNLILDLRNNEGGSEAQEIELLSYLLAKPCKLYQNIYLSHLDYRPLKEIIIERDSADLVFNNDDAYMRKLSNDLWINNYNYGANLKMQKPKPNVFQGNLYVLTNGITFSSAADLAAQIKKNRSAIFIGEEVGGVYEGPTGGASIVIQLPNSKIMVRISPNIFVGANYKKHEFGRGVLPDYPIEYSIADWLSNKDLALEKAKELIKNN